MESFYNSLLTKPSAAGLKRKAAATGESSRSKVKPRVATTDGKAPVSATAASLLVSSEKRPVNALSMGMQNTSTPRPTEAGEEDTAPHPDNEFRGDRYPQHSVLDAYFLRRLREEMGEKPRDNALEALKDWANFSVKSICSANRAFAELARRGKVNPRLLEDILNDEPINVTDEQIGLLQREVAKLRTQCDRAEHDAAMEHATAAERLIAITELEERVKEAKSERDEMEGRLESAKAELERRLANLQAEKQKKKDEERDLQRRLEQSERNLAELQGIMREKVPKLRSTTYREATELFLKKIKHQYPDADLGYFANLDDIPEVDVDGKLLPAIDDESVADAASDGEIGEGDGGEENAEEAA